MMFLMMPVVAVVVMVVVALRKNSTAMWLVMMDENQQVFSHAQRAMRLLWGVRSQTPCELYICRRRQPQSVCARKQKTCSRKRFATKTLKWCAVTHTLFFFGVSIDVCRDESRAYSGNSHLLAF